MKKGFTLVEVLISITIISVVSSLLVSVFVISLRTTSKINNLQIVRQNGSYVQTQMVKMLRFAQLFDGLSSDGTTFTPACLPPSTEPGTVEKFDYIRFTSFDGGQTTFSCDAAGGTIASNSASFFDTSILTVSGCSFSCTQISANTPYTIGITFTLSKRNALGLVEDAAPLRFQTAVTMRNTR